MRRILGIYFIILLTCMMAGAARQPENLDALKQRIENASPADQPKLCVEVAREQLQHMDDYYKAGDNANARRALQDVETYGVRAATASAQSGKHMKDTEIAVRKISYRLGEIEHNLDVDERPLVKAAAAKIDKAHTDLLFRMFAKR